MEDRGCVKVTVNIMKNENTDLSRIKIRQNLLRVHCISSLS